MKNFKTLIVSAILVSKALNNYPLITGCFFVGLVIGTIPIILKNLNEYYVIPGGGQEDGETIEQATLREIKEELGIEVELTNDFKKITNIYLARRPYKLLHCFR